eukprot:4635082-Amphidinium_carterae.1
MTGAIAAFGHARCTEWNFWCARFCSRPLTCAGCAGCPRLTEHLSERAISRGYRSALVRAQAAND